jgi:hypothetical protein
MPKNFGIEKVAKCKRFEIKRILMIKYSNLTFSREIFFFNFNPQTPSQA